MACQAALALRMTAGSGQPRRGPPILLATKEEQPIALPPPVRPDADRQRVEFPRRGLPEPPEDSEAEEREIEGEYYGRLLTARRLPRALRAGARRAAREWRAATLKALRMKRMLCARPTLAAWKAQISTSAAVATTMRDGFIPIPLCWMGRRGRKDLRKLKKFAMISSMLSRLHTNLFPRSADRRRPGARTLPRNEIPGAAGSLGAPPPEHLARHAKA